MYKRCQFKVGVLQSGVVGWSTNETPELREKRLLMLIIRALGMIEDEYDLCGAFFVMLAGSSLSRGQEQAIDADSSGRRRSEDGPSEVQTSFSFESGT